jgi:hypothetical protein
MVGVTSPLHSLTFLTISQRALWPDFVNRREHNIGREVARDAICKTGHLQRRSALDRRSATIPELALPHHIRFCWIVWAVRVARCSARKQVVAHGTGYHISGVSLALYLGFHSF